MQSQQSSLPLSTLRFLEEEAVLSPKLALGDDGRFCGCLECPCVANGAGVSCRCSWPLGPLQFAAEVLCRYGSFVVPMSDRGHQDFKLFSRLSCFFASVKEAHQRIELVKVLLRFGALAQNNLKLGLYVLVPSRSNNGDAH